MAPSPRPRPGSLAFTLPIAVLAAAYFVAGKLGLSLALVNTSTTAVWPPTGISLAALLLFGRRLWPGVLVGAFLVNVTTTGDVVSSIGIAIGNTLEAVVGAHLVTTFARGARAFERPADVLKFAFLGAVLSTIVSATIGTGTLTLTGFAQWNDFGAIWLTWWLGDAGGALLVAPALLTGAVDFDIRGLTSRPIERLALLAGIVGTALLLFGGIATISVNREPLAFLCFPVLVWAAFRFGPRETTAALLLLGLIGDWGTAHGFGAFARGDPNESLLLLQAFLGVAAVTADSLAAAVFDRQRGERIVHATEQRFRLVAEDAARLREEFLSTATHELRTPVASLRGYVQLAQHALDRGQDERVRTALKTALRQSDRVAALISELLDASLAHAGKLTISPVATDVSALVAMATDAARLTSETHRWSIAIEPGLYANVDPVRFEQVLLNLLENATKFSPAGTTIAVRLSADDGDLRLEVADQGIGISSDRLGRIFERFYQGHDDRGISGLGLGLYIARQILARHGGRIEVESEPGRGTTFRVTVARSAPEIVAPPFAERLPVKNTRGGRVLVVDDEPDIRALVAEVLRDAGLAVTTAADGREALATVARERPDLIILDKLMPGMDGTVFAQAYRAAGPAAPIIAFCAARDAAEWAASIGAAGFIGKPFDVKELERLVIEWLPPTAKVG
jgi:signal transduction histidine kinase